MDNKKVIHEILRAVGELAEDADRMREEQFGKMFYYLEKEAKLRDFLGCLTKAELDAIRKNLDLKGISNAKKSVLIEILNTQIKNYLSIILGRLIQKDYDLLVKIVNNGGSIKYKEEYSNSFHYLREYGILTGAVMERGKYLLIASDMLDEMREALNKLELIGKIKLNEKIYRVVKGLLFYYGIINIYQLHSKINTYLEVNVDMVTMNNIIFELQKRDNSIRLRGSFWCHEKVHDYDFIVDEVNKRPSLEYLSVTADMLLKAGNDSFKEWNKFDINFCSYLKANFKISDTEAEDYVNNLKFEFKRGQSFAEAMNRFSSVFSIRDFKMAQEISAMIQEVYNNSRQWLLKGKSPYEVSGKVFGALQDSPKSSSVVVKSKVGRNDSCPCGSGKKYKNCCLK